MHIEPGVITGAKLILSYGSAAVAFGMVMKSSIDLVKKEGSASLFIRSALAIPLVFFFFEILPHYSVGVSEVHFIFGASLFLLLGVAATSIGLVLGLLVQGLFFSPLDLPQYGANLTTLLIPLYVMNAMVDRIIPKKLPYIETSYSQVVSLSLIYQGGIISWVAFWVLMGQGFGAENIAQLASFCMAYTAIILIEPLVSLGILIGAKSLHSHKNMMVAERRLYYPAL